MKAMAMLIREIDLGRMLSEPAKVLEEWNARERQRRRLAELDDRLLGDIGVSRQAAASEAAKGFWLG